MAEYTGNAYFTKVQVAGSTDPAKVRDWDVNDKLQAKGSMLIANNDAASGLAQLASLPIGADGQVLSVSNGLPSWTSASAAAGVNNATLYLKVGSGTAAALFSANASNASTLSISSAADGSIQISNGSSTSTLSVVPAALTSTAALEDQLVTDGFAKTDDIKNGALQLKVGSDAASNLFTANQSATSGLTFAAGSTNGYITINSKALQIANFNDYATKSYAEGLTSGLASETFVNGATLAALNDAKAYADEKVSGLGTVMTVVGADTAAPASAITNPAAGNVYIKTDDGTEYVYTTAGAWEKLGENSIDLTPYVAKTTTIAGIDLQDNITAQELANALTTNLDLKALSHKDSASVTLNDYATDISLTAGTSEETIKSITTSASKITEWNGGSVAIGYTPPSFTVNGGVLSLSASTTDVSANYTAPTFTNTPVNATNVTITHNTYTASLTKGNKTITVS